MRDTLVVVAGGPAKAMVGYMVPGAVVVVAGAAIDPQARFHRVIVHEPALVGPRATAGERQAWFDGLSDRLDVGGALYRINTLSGVVDEALVQAPEGQHA